MKMPYFPDLSSYHNVHENVTNPDKIFKDVYYVGWLSSEYEFTKGQVDPLLLEKLKILISTKNIGTINTERGLVECPFCNEMPVYMPRGEIRPKLLGVSEVWIPNGNGQVYACNTMIYHFITEHYYKPPQGLLDSISNFDINSSWNANDFINESVEKFNDDN